MKRFLLFFSFLFIAQINAASKASDRYKNLTTEQAIKAYLSAHKIEPEFLVRYKKEFFDEEEWSKKKYKEKGGNNRITQWADGLVKGYDSEGFQDNQFDESLQRSKFFHPEGDYSYANIIQVAKKILNSFHGKKNNINYITLLLQNFNNINYMLEVMNNLAGLDGKVPNPEYEQHRARYDSKDLHKTILRLMVEQQLIREKIFNHLTDKGKQTVSKIYEQLDSYWHESDYQYVLDGVRLEFENADLQNVIAEYLNTSNQEYEDYLFALIQKHYKNLVTNAYPSQVSE